MNDEQIQIEVERLVEEVKNLKNSIIQLRSTVREGLTNKENNYE